MHYWLLWATAGIWTSFILYWNTSAARPASASSPAGSGPGRKPWISVQLKRATTAPPTTDGGKAGSRESSASRQVHQLLLWGALLLALLPWPWPLSIRWLPAAPWISPAGLALQVAFALLYVVAKRHLGRHWAGEIRTLTDHQIVRTGPYRWLRHPMYTAMLGMFAGTALVSGELHGLIALAIAVVAYGRKIRLEERHLLTALGGDYASYRRHSWALIPGLI